MNVTSTRRSVLGGAVLAALLAGCKNPTPVSPAVVNAPPAPPPVPMPNDADLGEPSGTFDALPDLAVAGQNQTGLSGTVTLTFNGRRYRGIYSGINMTGFASQVSPFQGEVFNLHNVTDFAGTYTLAAMSANRREAVVKNEKGVSLRIQAMRPIVGGFQSVTIRLTR